MWTASQCQDFLSMLSRMCIFFFCPSSISYSTPQTLQKAEKYGSLAVWWQQQVSVQNKLISWWLTHALVYWQFLNYYGHPSARISRFHAIEIDVTDMLQQPAEEASSARSQPTLFQKCINMYQTFLSLLLRLCVVFLFDAPTSHYLSLDRVFVDHIVCEIRFKTMMEDVIKDWGETSLLATVLWTWVDLTITTP